MEPHATHEDMTDLEMYVLFSPFGRIAPRGASARIDKDGTTDSTADQSQRGSRVPILMARSNGNDTK